MIHPYLRLLAANRNTARRSAPANSKQLAGVKGALYVEAIGAEDHFYLYDVIAGSKLEADWFGGVAAEEFVQALNNSVADSIHVHIDSPGGSVFAARAMSSAMRASGADITARIDGLAASAATLVAAAANNVVMGDPGAMMMIHRAWSWASGNAEDMLTTAALLEKIDGTIVDTYHARTGIPKEELSAMMAAETWFTAQEAVDRGFADSIAAGEPVALAHTPWDITAFLNPPKVSDNQSQPAHPAGEDGSGGQPLRARQLQRLRVAGLRFSST